MKPLTPPMYHYKIVFKNGHSLNVISAFDINPDNMAKWLKFGLEDANNTDWSSVKTVYIRSSAIMYFVLWNLGAYDTQNI